MHLVYRSVTSSFHSATFFFPSSLSQLMHGIYRRCVLERVSDLMRPLFFTYFPRLTTASEEEAQKLFADFWDETVPLRRELASYQQVKDHFTFSTVTFETEIEGESLDVTYGCIATKGLQPEDDAFNLVHALGIDCTENNDLMHTLPLLDKFIKEHPEKKGRFFLVSQYGAKKKEGSFHKHPSLKLAGKLTSDTFSSIEGKFGKIDEIIGHSLGGIVTAASLPFVKALPKHLIFDRSASSVEELSKSFWQGPFYIRLPFFADWNVDLGKEISLFAEKNSKTVQVVVIGAEHDHRFKGTQNLYTSPYIQTAEKIEKLILSPPERLISKYRHHSLPLDLCFFEHLDHKKSSQNLLKEGGNLASSLLKRGLS